MFAQASTVMRYMISYAIHLHFIQLTTWGTGSVVFSGPVVIGESKGIYEWDFRVENGESSIFGIVSEDYDPREASHG